MNTKTELNIIVLRDPPKEIRQFEKIAKEIYRKIVSQFKIIDNSYYRFKKLIIRIAFF